MTVRNGRPPDHATSEHALGSSPSPDQYREVLARALRTGTGPTRHELDRLHDAGARAARAGMPLADLLRSHLRVARAAVDDALPSGNASCSAPLDVVEHTLIALVRGYEECDRAAVREAEAERREFIDDLLGGSSDPERLPEQAERFGVRLASDHVAMVARIPRLPGHTPRSTEAVLGQRFGTDGVLVVGKAGHLVCVVPGRHHRLVEVIGEHVVATVHADRVGIGRRHHGPAGIARSYQEARRALELADRLAMTNRVVRLHDLAVYEVLLRDQAAILELVTTVLTPLQNSRLGPVVLVDTLAAYFRTGSAVAAARTLHVAVRTVTYRLTRVKELTGYDATDPTHRFTLEAAVLGAHLLPWPVRRPTP